MNETNIKVGSVVFLNSDDKKLPKMTVKSLTGHTDQIADVIWRTTGEAVHQAYIPLACLRLAGDSEDEGIPPG